MSDADPVRRTRRPTDVINRHWPPLEAAELAELGAHWRELSPVRDIRWHSPRPFAASGLVDTDGGTWFVKRHALAVRTAAQLEEEHRFIGWLQARDIPVSEPLPSRSGATALTLGQRTYEVHPLAPGVDLYREHASWEPFLSHAHARAAGAMLARLHAAAQGYPAPRRLARQLISSFELFEPPSFAANLECFIARRPALAAYVRQRNGWDELIALLEPWQRSWSEHPPPPSLWGHNDWHGSNLMWTSDDASAQVCTVLDFGLSNRTSAWFDLATALERSTIPWLDIQSGLPGAADLAAVRALLEGYQGVRRLTPEEAAGLARILPLVHVEFALSEVDYYHGTVHDREYADLAWEAFLIGHLRWFGSAEGRLLLDCLRGPAA